MLNVDDVMATGGTARAAELLAEQVQAIAVGTFCPTEMGILNGKKKSYYPFQSIVVE